MKAMRLPRRHRVLLVALGLSAAVHAAVFVGMPRRISAFEPQPAVYSATLEEAAASLGVPGAVAVPSPLPRRSARRPRQPDLAPAPDLVPASEVVQQAGSPAVAEAALSHELLESEADAAEPERIALAQPTTAPLNTVEPDPFPTDALPRDVAISYNITSAVADGRAVYRWERDGDRYRITGEAEAEGFFTLFLEGRVLQESRGIVTTEGLRPERFVETRPNNQREGLEFDWNGRRVTFERGSSSRTTPLEDNTVDWLSMIFQLAHVPPTGQSMGLQVFTQRKMYRYRLEVLGIEQIDIPLGRVRALHLRHADARDSREVVDVWLGLDQYNLPVKMRFPVARNRLMVEQVATRVTAEK